MVLAHAMAAHILLGLWYLFRWALTKSMLEGKGLLENMGWGKWSQHGLSGSAVGGALEPGLAGECLQENTGARHTVSKLGSTCWALHWFLLVALYLC